MAAVAGEASTNEQMTYVGVDGLEGRRVSWAGPRSGPRFSVEALYVRRDDTLWSIIVVYRGPALANDASRLIDSVSIK